MRRILIQFAAGMALFSSGDVCVASDEVPVKSRVSLLLVRGADGTNEFGQQFDEWEARWKAAAAKGDVAVSMVGTGSEAPPLDVLRRVLKDETDGSERPFWIVLIGHGTYDGRVAKFNLAGPDFTARELAEWLGPVNRPLAVINCASSSSPFIDRLSMPGRVVVTATTSGNEVSFTRFGDYLASSMDDPAADLDKDGQVSLMEGFLTASRQTASYYEGLGLLATEHALLDDNGDGRGLGADFFEGLRPVKVAESGATLDGLHAHQWHLVPSEEERRFPDALRPRRNELEREIATLRNRKSQLDDDVYYQLLEPLLIELAELYEQADREAEEAGQIPDSPKTGTEGEEPGSNSSRAAARPLPADDTSAQDTGDDQ